MLGIVALSRKLEEYRDCSRYSVRVVSFRKAKKCSSVNETADFWLYDGENTVHIRAGDWIEYFSQAGFVGEHESGRQMNSSLDISDFF